MRINLTSEFNMVYPSDNHAYYTGDFRTDIVKLLKDASEGYCMYCGVALEIEGMDLSQLEHSVDKKGNKGQRDKTPLTNCKFNLAIACKDCNMKYKKRVIKADLTNKFGKECSKRCDKPCPDYKKVREEYIEQNKIILQPEGIADENGSYVVQYDIFKHLYVPDASNDKERIRFIQHHINRFQLNRDKFSESIIDICSDIVELNELGINSKEALLKYLLRKRYLNILGKRFVEALNNKFSKRELSELILFCKTVVLCSAWI